MPIPARKRNSANSQTVWESAAAPVKTEKIRMEAARHLVRPKRSAMGPHRKDSPQPIRNRANRIEPAKAISAGPLARPDCGSKFLRAGGRARGEITATTQSKGHPA